jgi:hypothetical protein
MGQQRFEDTPGLFGVGICAGTSSTLICDWCGTKYPEIDPIDDSRRYANFGDKQVVECCFVKVESAVLGEIQNILPWFTRLLEARRAKLAEDNTLVDAVVRMTDAVVQAPATEESTPPKS